MLHMYILKYSVIIYDSNSRNQVYSSTYSTHLSYSVLRLATEILNVTRESSMNETLMELPKQNKNLEALP